MTLSLPFAIDGIVNVIVSSFVQTLTLLIIVILLECKINSYYEGAAKISMIWVHVANFVLFFGTVAVTFDDHWIQNQDTLIIIGFGFMLYL